MPYRILDGNACFTTHVCRHHTPVFTSPEQFEVICRSLEWCRANRGLRVYGYVIMPDHIHLLTNVISPEDLRDTFSALRRFTANRLFELARLGHKKWIFEALKKASTETDFWEDDYRPKDASRADIFDQKLHYIHMNPVRCGFVRQPEHWRYSSAGHYYRHEPGPVRVDDINERDVPRQSEADIAPDGAGAKSN